MVLSSLAKLLLRQAQATPLLLSPLELVFVELLEALLAWSSLLVSAFVQGFLLALASLSLAVRPARRRRCSSSPAPRARGVGAAWFDRSVALEDSCAYARASACALSARVRQFKSPA